MEEKLAYSSIAPHLYRLRLCGYYQIDPKSANVYKTLHKAFMYVTIIWIVVYTIQQAIKVVEVQDDTDKVMATLFLFLTHTDSIYKQVILWIKSDEIEELLNILRGPLYNQGEPEHEKYLKEVAKYSTLILRIDNYSALFTCFLWVLFPFVLHLQGKQVEFAIWLPFDVNVDPMYKSLFFFSFYFVALYVWLTTSWLAFSNTTSDILISFLLAQCKTQLSIIRYELEHLVRNSHVESKATGKSVSNIVGKRFGRIIQHHVQIVYFVKKVEHIFGNALAYLFLVSGWIICISVYRIVDMDPASIQFLSMIMYVFCILVQIFVYCHYGNELTHESGKLMESAYFFDWLEINVKHRRHLIFFMERIKRPIQPLAGALIPLSNETFVSVVKSSYSFYALLKGTSE